MVIFLLAIIKGLDSFKQGYYTTQFMFAKIRTGFCVEGLEGNCANKVAAGEEASREDTVDIHCRDKIRCQDDLLVYGHLEWGKEASRMSAGSLA